MSIKFVTCSPSQCSSSSPWNIPLQASGAQVAGIAETHLDAGVSPHLKDIKITRKLHYSLFGFHLRNSIIGGARMTAHFSYVCWIQEVDGGEYDMTGLRATNLAKSKFDSVVND
ncbi:hypothetical protein AVEN_51384-1 [Araneus ventricosus]|uniref:Uncharacterized protein n=1 Tax=Araneus ventricosus TaxID=182803 RepID=A0A4Y2MSR1_ARAVE|nr:hypothetical protein AVEN_51384-1 [Araneus ventricosus]